MQVPVVSSQVPPLSLQSSALLAVDAVLASLGSLGSLGELTELGELGELGELAEDAAEPPSEACAIDMVVNAGTA